MSFKKTCQDNYDAQKDNDNGKLRVLLAMSIGMTLDPSHRQISAQLWRKQKAQPTKTQLLEEARRRYVVLKKAQPDYRPCKPTTGWNKEQLMKWLTQNPIRDEQDVDFLTMALLEACIVKVEENLGSFSSSNNHKTTTATEEPSSFSSSPPPATASVSSDDSFLQAKMLLRKDPIPSTSSSTMSSPFNHDFRMDNDDDDDNMAGAGATAEEILMMSPLAVEDLLTSKPNHHHHHHHHDEDDDHARSSPALVSSARDLPRAREWRKANQQQQQQHHAPHTTTVVSSSSVASSADMMASVGGSCASGLELEVVSIMSRMSFDSFSVSHATPSFMSAAGSFLSKGSSVSMVSAFDGFQVVEVDKPQGEWGLVLNTVAEGELVVHKRRSASVAKDLREGDRLLFLDGQDVTAMASSEVAQLIYSKIHRTARFVFLRSTPSEPTTTTTAGPSSSSSSSSSSSLLYDHRNRKSSGVIYL